MKNDHQGFTLVELLVIVGLISLLAALVIPNALRARITTNDTTAKTSLKTIAVALENYLNDNGQYPSDINLLITVSPPYLNTNFFTGTHNGFTYATTTLETYFFTITATPISSSQGSGNFSIDSSGTITGPF